MTGTWMTLEQAASELGISLRTLHRWIDKGRVETRMSDGRREVLIDSHERDAAHADPNVTDTDTHAADTPDRSLVLASGAIRGWQQAADLAQDQVEAARHDMGRSRRISGLLAAVVAVLVVAGGVGLWWGTRAVTTERAHKDALTGRLEASTARITSLARDFAAERQRGDELAEQFRQKSEEAAVLGVSCDRLAGDLADAQAHVDALETKQRQTVWAAPPSPDVMVDAEPAEGNGDEPAPGG